MPAVIDSRVWQHLHSMPAIPRPARTGGADLFAQAFESVMLTLAAARWTTSHPGWRLWGTSVNAGMITYRLLEAATPRSLSPAARNRRRCLRTFATGGEDGHALTVARKSKLRAYACTRPLLIACVSRACHGMSWSSRNSRSFRQPRPDTRSVFWPL